MVGQRCGRGAVRGAMRSAGRKPSCRNLRVAVATSPAIDGETRRSLSVVELAEYRRMAEAGDTHWWYRSTRALLREFLADRLPPGGRFLDLGLERGPPARGSPTTEKSWPLTSNRWRSCCTASYIRVRGRCFRHGVPTVRRRLLRRCLVRHRVCHRSIESPLAVVREMARVVRPGARLASGSPAFVDCAGHPIVRLTAGDSLDPDLPACSPATVGRVERSTAAYSFLVPPAAAKMLVERGETSSDLDRRWRAWVACCRRLLQPSVGS